MQRQRPDPLHQSCGTLRVEILLTHQRQQNDWIITIFRGKLHTSGVVTFSSWKFLHSDMVKGPPEFLPSHLANLFLSNCRNRTDTDIPPSQTWRVSGLPMRMTHVVYSQMLELNILCLQSMRYCYYSYHQCTYSWKIPIVFKAKCAIRDFKI